MIKIDGEVKQVVKDMPCGNIFCPANIGSKCGYNGGECPKYMKPQ